MWGSGTEQFGKKADPNKPVHSVNLKADEWEVLLGLPDLLSTPDLKGADWEKFVGLTGKFFDIAKDRKPSPTNKEGKLTPNRGYDITDLSPVGFLPDTRRTIIRTDDNGDVKDTIKWPSEQQLKSGKSKYDTLPTKKENEKPKK